MRGPLEQCTELRDTRRPIEQGRTMQFNSSTMLVDLVEANGAVGLCKERQPSQQEDRSSLLNQATGESKTCGPVARCTDKSPNDDENNGINNINYYDNAAVIDFDEDVMRSSIEQCSKLPEKRGPIEQCTE